MKPASSHNRSLHGPILDEAIIIHDFEAAIDACGYGIFHICLLILTVLCVTATIFETSSMSYILPTAECDLKLSLMHKGILNGISYAGMITSAIPWGYVADTIGRKAVLTYGLTIDGLFTICCACSQNVQQLLVFKFFGGFTNAGPFAVIMAYISEFHGRKQRSRVMMIVGMLKSIVMITLPLLAFFLLPYHVYFTFIGLKFHTWHIFVAITSIPAFVSGSLFTLFPESPKFLMSQGRNEEALKSFQLIYAVNKGKDRFSFPIKNLHQEVPRRSRASVLNSTSPRRSLKEMGQNAISSLYEGVQQLRPLFTKEYLGLAVLVYFMDFCILLSLNTVRLWLPQLFATMTEYENAGLGKPSLCEVLFYNVNKTKLLSYQKIEDDCDVHIESASYVKNIYVAASGFFGYFVASFIVNKVGNNVILSVTIAISTLCAYGLYFCETPIATLIVACIFITVAGVSVTTVISVSVSIFPTGMRTTVIILVMTFGRVGSLMGNLLFPIFISIGCIPPFILVGTVMLVAGILSLFLPKTTKIPLK